METNEIVITNEGMPFDINGNLSISGGVISGLSEQQSRDVYSNILKNVLSEKVAAVEKLSDITKLPATVPEIFIEEGRRINDYKRRCEIVFAKIQKKWGSIDFDHWIFAEISKEHELSIMTNLRFDFGELEELITLCINDEEIYNSDYGKYKVKKYELDMYESFEELMDLLWDIEDRLETLEAIFEN